MRIPGFNGLTPFAVFKHAIKGFFDDDMATYGAALSYHILLALFPFVIFLLTLLVALGLSDFFAWLLSQARIALPGDAFRLVERVIGEIQHQTRGGLLSFSIVFAIWAASAGVRSLMHALNVAYDVTETRPAWQRYPLSILYTLGLAVLLIAAAGLMLVGPRAVQWLTGQIRLSHAAATLWNWLRWPLAILLLLLAFAVIYKVAPNIDQPFRFVTPGSVVGVAAWIVPRSGSPPMSSVSATTAPPTAALAGSSCCSSISSSPPPCCSSAPRSTPPSIRPRPRKSLAHPTGHEPLPRSGGPLVIAPWSRRARLHPTPRCSGAKQRSPPGRCKGVTTIRSVRDGGPGARDGGVRDGPRRQREDRSASR
jgi:membrane protein